MSETFHISVPGASDDGDVASHRAHDFLRQAWYVGCRAPLLFSWKIVGDVVGLLLRPIALFWVTAVVAAGYGIGLRSTGSPVRALLQVDPLQLAAGLAGFAATFWLAGIVVDSIVGGGIFETFALAFEERELGGSLGFFGRVGTGFLRLVGLRLTVAVAQAALTLLGATVGIAILYGFGVSGALRDASIASRSLFIAIPLFVYFSLALLVRATLRIAAAPLFVDSISVGEAIAVAVEFLVEHFSGLYRILVRVAGLLLVPLLAYWAIAIGTQLWGLEGPFGPLLQGFQIVGQIAVLASFSVAALLFDGAVFAYYAQTKGRLSIPGTADVDRSSESSAIQSPYDESTTLEELLPDSYEHVVTFPDPAVFGADDED